jgi:hypothetical protein
MWFFEVLGIDRDADVGAIRRAYAKAIKECDQASEPERFQRIREAYEMALQWINPDEPPIAITPPLAAETVAAPPFPSSRSAAQPPVHTQSSSTQALARRVADEFESALRQEGNDAIYELLDKFSADQRLTSLDEKSAFELMVLELCFAMPPNIGLLDAAGDRFEWEAASRHLGARPDLVMRMQRHWSLRMALSVNKFKDAKEFEEAVKFYRALQRRPKRRAQAWRILWTNRLLAAYEEFRHELNERYGERALDWWRQRLAEDPPLMGAYRQRQAAGRGVANPRRPARFNRNKIALVVLVLAILLAIVGRSILLHE